MYELTCPSCRHVANIPFVRNGAMATCPQCKQQYQVKAENYRRQAMAGEGNEPFEAMTPPSMVAAAGMHPTPPPAPAKAGVGPAIDHISAPTPPPVSSLFVGREISPQPVTPPTRPAPPATPPAPIPITETIAPVAPPPPRSPPVDPAVARIIQRGARRRRSNDAAIWLGVFLLAAIGLTVAFVAYERSNQAIELAPAFVPTESGDPDMPNLTGEAVPLAGQWVDVDEPADAAPNDEAVKLEHGKIVRDSDNTAFYEAVVTTQGLEFIDTATIELALVNAKGRVFARMRFPLELLDAQEVRSLRVPIDPVRRELTSRVDWSVEIGAKIKSGVLFEDPLIEPDKSGRRNAVKITAYNPLSTPLKGAIFLATQTDDQGHVLGQWRITWTQTILGFKGVKFKAIVGVDTGQSVPQWKVIGVGASEPLPGNDRR